MKPLLLLTFTLIFIYANGQSTEKTDSVASKVKAQYLRGDITKSMISKIVYPTDALTQGIQGDVILSFTITKNGKLENLKIVSSPDMLLSQSTIIAFDALENEWSPFKVNNTPVNKEYLMVFRFRIYKEGESSEYDQNRKDKYIANQQYDKALKLLNKAIDANKFSTDLFYSRSKVKEMLGDTDGAKSDLLFSEKLEDNLMSVGDITVLSRSYTKSVPAGAVPRP
jgi:tetratricopeptide (TPR) repeat protein